MSGVQNKTVLSAALQKEVKKFAAEHGYSVSKAIAVLVKRGLGVDLPAQDTTHGGQRWHQCPNCNGWNVGIYESKRICADCGWKE